MAIVKQFGFTTSSGTLANLVDLNGATGWAPYPTMLTSYTAPFLDPSTGQPNVGASFAAIEIDLEDDWNVPTFSMQCETETTLGPCMLIASNFPATGPSDVVQTGDLLMGMYTAEELTGDVALLTAALGTKALRRYYRMIFRKQDAIVPPAGLTWNPSDKSANVTLSVGNKRADMPSSNGGARGTVSHNTGKWYIEFPLYSNAFASGLLGFADTAYDYTSTSPQGNNFGLIQNGHFSSAAQSNSATGLGDPDGKHVSFAVDYDNAKAWVRYDGGPWIGYPGTSVGDPAAGTNGLSIVGNTSYQNYPMIRFQGTSYITVNGGDTAFTYAPPAGFIGWTAPPTQPMDGTNIFEIWLGTSIKTSYNNADYDSIWGKGDRIANGLITASQGGWGGVFAGFSQAFDSDYSAAAGNGPYLTSAVAGAYLGMDFGEYGFVIRGLKFVSTETIAIDPGSAKFFACYGGISTGTTIVRSHSFGGFNIDNHAEAPYDVVEIDFDNPIAIAFPYYEIIALSTVSGGRLFNELWISIDHSPLDGGDRRNSATAKYVQVSTNLTVTGSLTSLMDGETSTGNSGVGAPADVTFTVTSTPGDWIKFTFPRKVVMQQMIFNVADRENYDSGGNPTVYGKWQWQGSDDGSSWTNVGDVWQFMEDCYFMLAPSPDYYFGDSFVPSEFYQWRMVLVTGPAFGVTLEIYEVIFNLIDFHAQISTSTFTAPFSDDSDDGMSAAVITLGAPAPSDEISFTDSIADKFEGALTVTTNYSLSAAFDDDGSTFEIVSDIFPSNRPQVFSYSTGRR